MFIHTYMYYILFLIIRDIHVLRSYITYYVVYANVNSITRKNVKHCIFIFNDFPMTYSREKPKIK